LWAARLVGGGHRLYTDFFSQQMPLVPWLWAGWGRLCGFGWVGARGLAGLLFAGSGWLVYRIAARAAGRPDWGAAAAAAFALNGLCLGWLPTIKTHGLATFLLLGAWEVLAAGSAS